MKPSLAHGPVRRLLSRPDALHCDHETFADTWPQLIRSGLYRPFGYYSRCCRWRRTGGSSAVANSSAVTTGRGARKSSSGCIPFAQIVAVVTEQIQNRVSNNVDYDLLCHERDNFRILVAITNAVLSRLDIDELVSEVAKEIHRYFRIDAISVVLRSDRKGKLNIYSTHYLDASHPVHDQSEVDEAGTLTERVFKSKEMLLLNLHEHDTLAPYEKMLFEMWGNKIQTLCLLPLMSGNTLLGGA
ncbi:GAF domain-containing protein [Klebsiella pneumoniae subsp. pneumoniae]|nr:GAF domain-containing protein [Klebsiella pneumoniae subsp. pneumoniae]